MLVRHLSKYAAVLLALAAFLPSGAATPGNTEVRAPVELINFKGMPVTEFRDWCTDNAVEPIFYGTPGGSSITTYPKMGTVLQNHSLTKAGDTVKTGALVRVVLELVPVDDFKGKTAGKFRAWCRDWGMKSRFFTSSGGIYVNPPSLEPIVGNETTGDVKVGSTVGVIVNGPFFLTLAFAVGAALTLVLIAGAALLIGRRIERSRME